MTGLVSILIPAYNAKQWIRQSIESALGQSYAPIEVIVMDDGSTDGTVEEILSFGDRIQFLRGAHAGANAARNSLTECARGEWLQYLDADDYLLPNKVADQMRFVADCGGAFDVVYSPTIIRREETGQETRTPFAAPFDATVQFIRWIPFCTHGVLMRREAVLAAGGWKAGQPVCQEHELLFRLLTSGRKFGAWPHAATVYRQHGTATVSRSNPLRTIQMRMSILDRFEAWLVGSGRLTAEHRRALYIARLDTARVAWPLDRAYGEGLARQAAGTGHFLIAGNHAIPLRFQLLQRVCGFRAAQLCAQVARAPLTAYR